MTSAVLGPRWPVSSCLLHQHHIPHPWGLVVTSYCPWPCGPCCRMTLSSVDTISGIHPPPPFSIEAGNETGFLPHMITLKQNENKTLYFHLYPQSRCCFQQHQLLMSLGSRNETVCVLGSQSTQLWDSSVSGIPYYVFWWMEKSTPTIKLQKRAEVETWPAAQNLTWWNGTGEFYPHWLGSSLDMLKWL